MSKRPKIDLRKVTPWMRVSGVNLSHRFYRGRSLCGQWAVHFPSPAPSLFSPRTCCLLCFDAYRVSVSAGVVTS